MKYLVSFVLLCLVVKAPDNGKEPQKLTLSKSQLRDKIRGAWAGQTIGVTFANPISIANSKTRISDLQPIPWNKGYLKDNFLANRDLYDDLYLDLTFIRLFDKTGLDVPINILAKAYAMGGYQLSHANQASRYNILNGIEPPLSGHWTNNPHADDSDFQIVADFAGIIAPGMPRTATAMCDKVGHIMSYGDGFYGGLYVANLYSLAFVHNAPEMLIQEAITAVPHRTSFNQCINDVLKWHKEYPHDWKRTWFELQRKWNENAGCSMGVRSNTDAKLNAAYVTLGLLYGQRDYTRTFEIITHAGMNAKSNCSSAGGVLGVMMGFKKIPDFWKQDIAEIDSVDFSYAGLSLREACDASYRLALNSIERHDGKVKNDKVVISRQRTTTAKVERNFEGHYPAERRVLEDKNIVDQFEMEFEGIGFVLRGETSGPSDALDYVFESELYIDNKYIEKVFLPVNPAYRRPDLFWKYQLPHGKHQVRIVILNPSAVHSIKATEMIVYNINTY